jgi:hypothetical protein
MPKPKHDNPEKHTSAQRSYHQRQLDKGMTRLSVYVPTRDRDNFWDAIDRLRDKWHAEGLID